MYIYIYLVIYIIKLVHYYVHNIKYYVHTHTHNSKALWAATLTQLCWARERNGPARCACAPPPPNRDTTYLRNRNTCTWASYVSVTVAGCVSGDLRPAIAPPPPPQQQQQPAANPAPQHPPPTPTVAVFLSMRNFARANINRRGPAYK